MEKSNGKLLEMLYSRSILSDSFYGILYKKGIETLNLLSYYRKRFNYLANIKELSFLCRFFKSPFELLFIFVVYKK
jgi:hypothetical protein